MKFLFIEGSHPKLSADKIGSHCSYFFFFKLNYIKATRKKSWFYCCTIPADSVVQYDRC